MILQDGCPFTLDVTVSKSREPRDLVVVNSLIRLSYRLSTSVFTDLVSPWPLQS